MLYLRDFEVEFKTPVQEQLILPLMGISEKILQSVFHLKRILNFQIQSLFDLALKKAQRR
jgi:hypothetical protein